MVDTIDQTTPLDLEDGRNEEPISSSQRISPIQADDRSIDSYKSRWSDEMTGDEAMEPPRRPTYRNFLGAPTRSFSSSSVSSYAKKGTAWKCTSCSYENADFNSTTCAICGFPHQQQGAGKSSRSSPTPSLADRSVLSISSNTSRVTPMTDATIKSSSASTISSNFSGASSHSSTGKSVMSMESLNSFLGRRDSASSSRRTSNSSVDSQSSAATAKRSNTVKDHFWRTRKKPQQESIVEGTDENSTDSNSAKANSPHREQDTGGSLNSRGVRSPRISNGRALHDSMDDVEVVSPTLSNPSTRSTYVPPLAPNTVRTTPRSNSQEENTSTTSDRDQQITDAALLAPCCGSSQTRNISAFDAQTLSSDGGRSSTLDYGCESATYQASPSSLTARDDMSIVSEVSVFVNDPTEEPKERARELRAKTKERLTIASVCCMLLVAMAVSIIVLVVVTRDSNTNPATQLSTGAATQAPTIIGEVVSTPTPAPTFSPTTNKPTEFFDLLPQTRPPTMTPTDRPTKPRTPPPTVPLKDFEEAVAPIWREVNNSEVGTFVKLAKSGGVLASSSKNGVVRVFTEEAGIWQQLGQDITTLNGSNAASPIALSTADGQVLARLDDGTVRVFEYTGFDWAPRGEDMVTSSTDDDESSISLSADGSKLAVATPDDGSGNGRVRVYQYDASTGNYGAWKMIGAELAGYSGQSGFDIELSDDGVRLAVATWRRDEDAKTDDVFKDRHVRVHAFTGTRDWKLVGDQVELTDKKVLEQSKVTVSLGADGYVLAACTTKYCCLYEYDGIKEQWRGVGDEIPGGADVSLSSNGTVLAVGIPAEFSSAGIVKIFRRQGETWLLLGNDIRNSVFGDQLGYSVSISGGRVAVGSPKKDVGYFNNNGSVETYQLD